MIIANKTDRSLAINILEKAFKNSHSVCSLLRNKNNKYYLRNLIEYSVDYSFRRNGVYFSDNKKCVALCYKHTPENKWQDVFEQLKLLITTIPVTKLNTLLNHINYIKKSKPKKDFLYFWYLGATLDENGLKCTKALINELFKKADGEQLDIYAETTNIKNKTVYERFGLEVYKVWHNEKLDITVWFMKRDYKR
ncbi:MAG: hypothetical protein ACLGGV_02425 [Bacteroidia bacterium]